MHNSGQFCRESGNSDTELSVLTDGSMSVNAWLQQPQARNGSILFGMKAVRIVGIALGAVVVLYFLVISFIPEWMIVGVHFRSH